MAQNRVLNRVLKENAIFVSLLKQTLVKKSYSGSQPEGRQFKSGPRNQFPFVLTF